jgi:PAS domain S-box-containing protein
MDLNAISLSSAGSLAVAAIALFAVAFQGWLFLRRRDLVYSGWGALLSLATALYAAAVFMQFNTGVGRYNHLAEFLQFTSLVLVIHAAYGFTLAYLQIPARRYHQIAGSWHAVLVLVLWTTDLIVGRSFIHREFAWLGKTYVEPALGPLGPYFLGYLALAGTFTLYVWIRRGHGVQRLILGAGIFIWAALGLHDLLATLGLRTVQFLMEYGFLAFSVAALSVSLRHYVHLFEVSEQREERLASEAEQLAVTLRSIGEGFIATDNEERILLFNRAAEEISGWTQEEARGRPLAEVYPALFVDRRRLQDLQREGGSKLLRASGAHVALDGTERTISETRSPIHDREGRVVGQVLILRDVTERRKLQQQLVHSKKMEAVGVLAGGVAHDLNNILAGLASYPDLLLLHLPDDSPLRRPVMTIKKSGEKAAAIVHDMLTLARRGVTTSEVINLNRVVEDFLKSPEFFNIRLHHQNVTIEHELDDDLGHILGSPVHLTKSLTNLVSNAAEALPDGGTVKIRTSRRELTDPLQVYEVVEPGRYAALQVVDDGIGISPGDVQKIFEPFYTKKEMGRSGTGLGMPVVYGTVKDHHGFIDVQSVEGRGTTFTLYLPITEALLAESSARIDLQKVMGAGESILVVDDVEEQREIATGMLEKLGYAVAAVNSGEAAVDHLKDKGADLLLLDMIMDPGIDGLETFKRAREVQPEVKVIIASGYSETARCQEARDLGAGPYLQKPYSLKQIAQLVRDVLDA